MTPPRGSSASSSALFLTPEEPKVGSGGGALRSASLLAYLESKYAVQTVTFSLRPHSRSAAARIWRNAARAARGIPPLFDRFSGYEDQVARSLRGRYAVGVVEHFWCASYAGLLRTCCDRLVLDLHNIESQLARTHAGAAPWPASWASARFAESYLRLERKWLPRYDLILAASQCDLDRVRQIDGNAEVRVFPNALPEVARPMVRETDAIVFSGNLEYHPNVEAVRWFRSSIWPRVRERAAGVEWRLVGSNPAAIAAHTGGDAQIQVVGPVDDAIPQLAAAKVCVVPLLSGSGTRFKILEAWAAGRAVVSTKLGAEGLGARDGEHLLLADDPTAFAEAVLQLWNDPALRTRLGDAGRALYEDRFTWPAAWRALEEAGGI
jgi:glycosyltransferase involved in cell wall biosynthesis